MEDFGFNYLDVDLIVIRPLPEGGLFSFHCFLFFFSVLRSEKLFLHAFISLHMVRCLHRRGQQLLFAKVKNANWQDWYI